MDGDGYCEKVGSGYVCKNRRFERWCLFTQNTSSTIPPYEGKNEIGGHKLRKSNGEVSVVDSETFSKRNEKENFEVILFLKSSGDASKTYKTL